MEVRCPRCGYDQTGVMSAWRESCPVQGRCSECGLDFLWCDAVVPPRCEGLVEHAKTFRQWVWWGARTFARTWRPKRFWNWLRMEYRPRVWKSVVWFVCAMAALDVAVAVIMLTRRAVSSRKSGSLSFVGAFGEEFSRSMRWDAWLWWLPKGFVEPAWDNSRLVEVLMRLEAGRYQWWLLPALVMLHVGPLMLVVLPWTRARAKVELRHVVRWLVYSQALWLLMFLWGGVAIAGAWIQQETYSSFPRVSMTTPDGHSTFEIVVPKWWHALEEIAWPMESEWIVPLALLAWLCWWNWCALKFGMRIEKPAALWWAVMVPTALVGAIVVTLQALGLGIFCPGLA